MTPNRKPDLILGDYLMRWYVIPRNRVFNIYYHQFIGDDPGDDLHDHPWFSLSIVQSGEYREILKNGHLIRRPGDWIFRSPWKPHRVELPSGPCETLFITGPAIRTWGFYTANSWMPFYDVTGR